MQRLYISSSLKCHPASYLFLLFITVFGVTTTTTFISRPCALLFGSTSPPGEVAFQPSLRQKLSLLQTQLGSLLEQLHTDDTDPNGASKYAGSVLRVALQLEEFANQLSGVLEGGRSQQPCDAAQEDAYVNGSSEGGEADEELEGERLVFTSKEARSYAAPRLNRHGAKSFMGVDAVRPSVGLHCAAAMPTNFERFMEYDAHRPCRDDWPEAQKLMLAGCDPLPRRRCFSRATRRYSKPLSAPSALWELPGDENILWSQYKCKSFSCLLSSNTTASQKGFFKCSQCFNFSRKGWEDVQDEDTSAEFAVDQVLQLKVGEIRIGLDFRVTTGTFAALMKERDVTVISATMNFGAPFSEVIASRGLLPLYTSVVSRLPFFDNTLDMIHTYLLLDGWIAPEILEFVLYDWDRVLRPGGILWVDRFFCAEDDMKMYQAEFEKMRYKKLLWRVVPKTDRSSNELYLSAVLEKPLRP